MDSFNHELADEIKQMKESFDLLKSDVFVTKNVNSLLS